MEIIAALTVGGLAGIGMWMLLDRNLVRVVLGIVVLGNAINLGVLTAGRYFGESAAFVSATHVPSDAANPLPQALVLTAIVIGFATTALFLVVLLALRGLSGTDHVDGQEET